MGSFPIVRHKAHRCNLVTAMFQIDTFKGAVRKSIETDGASARDGVRPEEFAPTGR